MAIPKGYKEVMVLPDKHFWLEVMDQEMETIEAHQTWMRVDCLKGMSIVHSHWVHDLKTDEEEDYKARFVAHIA